MKNLLLVAVALSTSACAGMPKLEMSRADLSDSEIRLGLFGPIVDCDPTPELIYSKTGDLIEVINPILHPECERRGMLAVAPAMAEAAIEAVAPAAPVVIAREINEAPMISMRPAQPRSFTTTALSSGIVTVEDDLFGTVQLAEARRLRDEDGERLAQPLPRTDRPARDEKTPAPDEPEGDEPDGSDGDDDDQGSKPPSCGTKGCF